MIQISLLDDLTWNQMKRRAEGKQAILYDFSCLSKDSPAPARSSWQIGEQENPYLERRNLLHFSAFLTVPFLKSCHFVHEIIFEIKTLRHNFSSEDGHLQIDSKAQSQFIGYFFNRESYFLGYILRSI